MTEMFDVLLEQARDKYEKDIEEEDRKSHQAACDMLKRYLNNEIEFEYLPNHLQQMIKGTAPISRSDIARFMSEKTPSDPRSKYMEHLIEEYSKEPPDTVWPPKKIRTIWHIPGRPID